MNKSIENSTLYATTEQLQDAVAYIVLFQTEKNVECLHLLTNGVRHDFVDRDLFFYWLDNNKIEKVETLDKSIIKELKERYCK